MISAEQIAEWKRLEPATLSDSSTKITDGILVGYIERIRRTLRGGLPDLLTREKADIILLIEYLRTARTAVPALIAGYEALEKENAGLKRWKLNLSELLDLVPAQKAKDILDETRAREGRLVEMLGRWSALKTKLQTISVRANTYGPGFPATYADALWSLAREAETIQAEIDASGVLPKGRG